MKETTWAGRRSGRGSEEVPGGEEGRGGRGGSGSYGSGEVTGQGGDTEGQEATGRGKGI